MVYVTPFARSKLLYLIRPFKEPTRKTNSCIDLSSFACKLKSCKSFLQVVVCLYALSVLGRLVSGVTVAYTGMSGLPNCLYFFLSYKVINMHDVLVGPFSRHVVKHCSLICFTNLICSAQQLQIPYLQFCYTYSYNFKRLC